MTIFYTTSGGLTVRLWYYRLVRVEFETTFICLYRAIMLTGYRILHRLFEKRR